MRYFRHETPKKRFTLYPLVCLHVGVKQSADGFIREHIKRILADPDGMAIYMGDAGECTLKTSKGDIYQQTLNPGEQLHYAAELLQPLADADKLLWGIRGNHGNRIYNEVGLDWDETLCLRLGIPYLGESVFMRLVVGDKRGSRYDIFVHHGTGGTVNIGGKINKGLKFNTLVDADAVLTAHSHICLEAPPETKAFLPNIKREIQWRMQHSYICGCGYDSRTGYAAEKAYSPILPAYLGVTFHGYTDHDKTAAESRKQTCQVWRMDP